MALAQLAADLTDKTGSKLVMPSANDCYSQSAADRGARSIVMSASVCLCVCLSAINHIFGSTRPIFTELFMRVTSAASVSQSSTSLNISYLLRPDRGAQYCDERVCLSVCLCVFLSAIISSDLHVRSSPNFLRVSRSSSGGVVIRYALPVLWMTPYLLINQGCSTSPTS